MKKPLIPILILGIVISITVYAARSAIMKNNETNSSVTIKKGTIHTMKITSPAFANNENIPTLYTCKGKDINPPLTITEAPEETKSLVLIVDDPDAPGGTWVHWVLYNISPAIKQIAENSVPENAIQGNSSFGKPSYGGPCPPSGTHHYHFKLYALDATLVFDKPDQVNKQLVEEQMKEHIIDQAELIGLFSK